MARALALGIVLLGCPGPRSGAEPGAPRRRHHAAIEVTEDTLRAGLASLGDGGGALLELLDDDAWLLHHGTTDVLRGRDTIGRYLQTLAAAYPGLRVEPSVPMAVGDEGWVVEARLGDEGGGSGSLLALVRTRRKTIVSVELFGDDPRGLSSSSKWAPAPAVSRRMEIVPAATLDPAWAPAGLEDRLDGAVPLDAFESIEIRLAARSTSAALAVVVARGTDADGVPVSVHAAVLTTARGEERTPTRVDLNTYLNPREASVFEMGNLTRGHGHEDLLRSKLHSDTLRWGAWQGFCCEHGTRTRACRVIGLPAMPRCRTLNRLAFVCRQAYHCTGPECFCCSSGLDAACEMDDVPELDPEVPPSRRPPAPTVWSPY